MGAFDDATRLARDAIALLRQHPTHLVLPLVILALVTGAGGGAPADPSSLDPIEMVPFYELAAIAAVVALVVVLAIVFLVLAIVATSLVWTATARATHDAMDGAPVDWMGALRGIAPRWLALTGTWLLAILLILGGLILLVVPGIIIAAGLLPLAGVLAREGLAGPDALRRAWAISKGKKGVLVLLLLAGILLELAVGIVLGWIPLVGWIASALAGGGVAAAWITIGVRLQRDATPPAAPAPTAAHPGEAPPPSW